MDQFLSDITPFFYRKHISYVDVGAHVGTTYEALRKAKLSVKEAHLIEPNPASFSKLKDKVAEIARGKSVSLHKLALGDTKGEIQMQADDTMTRVIGAQAGKDGSGKTDENRFETPITTLDELASSFQRRHVSLLKVDVEGFEEHVLAGATGLLKDEAIDVIYIEAGLDPDNEQQCYYRKIEDILAGYGYRIFRIYEQKNEWLDDSPTLRRVNIAFMSKRFAAENPYRLTKEIFESKKQNNDYKAQIATLGQNLSTTEKALKEAEKAQAAVKLQAETAEREHVADISRLQAEQKEIAARLAQEENQHKALRKEHEELSQRLAKEENSRQALLKEHEELSARFAQEEKQRQALRTEYEALSTRLAQEEHQREALQQERDELSEMLLEEQRARNAHQQEHDEILERLADKENQNAVLQSERDTLSGKLSATEQRYTILSKQHDGARVELAQERDQNEAGHQERVDLALKLSEVEKRRKKLKRENEALLADLAEREKRLAEASGAVAALTRDRSALVDYGDQLEKRYRMLLSSTSWQATAPFRLIVRNVKSLLTGKPFKPNRTLKLPKLSKLPDRSGLSLARAQEPGRKSGAEAGAGRENAAAGRLSKSHTGDATVSHATRATPNDLAKAFSSINSAAVDRLTDIARDSLPQPAKDTIKKIVEKKKTLLNPSDDDLLADPRKTARYIIDLIGASKIADINGLRRQLESRLATKQGALLHDFLMVTFGKKISAFGFGAQAMDRLTARYAGDRTCFAAELGETAYRRLVSDGAISLTRVGRYKDALALLDQEIARGLDALRSVRAEVSWIHDPEQAVQDLEVHGGRRGTGGLKKGDGLLHAHLISTVLDRHYDERALAKKGGEYLLVMANRALNYERTTDYRRFLNRYFEEQNLSPPLTTSDDAFSFDHLITNTALRSIANGPLVSVVMTSYNSAATVGYAVRSILEQTYRNIEVFIVDDCSTDHSREVLAQIASRDTRVKVLHNERNLGTYGAKNRAIALSSGSYITCHDSDDWAHPQRIEKHVKAMQANPALVATRSNWLRLDAAGKIDFRRWNKRFSHPNPASMFFKRENLEKVGFFDCVHFGGDSEYWFRTQRVFGRSSVMSLSECLAIGLYNPSSLTRTGNGVMDAENYSPVRSAYQWSYFSFHAESSEQELILEAYPAKRRFWAPVSMISDTLPQNGELRSFAQLYPKNDFPNFVFGISLASKQAVKNWAHTERLLARTLRSVLNQTDPRFRVIVCGHDRPALDEFEDPRVIFMVADIKPPANPGQFRKDKMWKRRLIGAALRNMGGGYFFPLDADDLVHNQLVAHVLSDDNGYGYNIAQGYAEDFLNRRLAPVPGAWSVPFDRVCGSSAVIYFEPDDLPLDGRNDESLYFNLFQSHAYWPIVAEESGRPLAMIPFPAAVYVVNHSQNLSFGLQRAGQRTQNIISSIERNALSNRNGILGEHFAQQLRMEE